MTDYSAIEETIYGATAEALRSYRMDRLIAARDAAQGMLDSGRFKRNDMLRRMVDICNEELARRDDTG